MKLPWSSDDKTKVVESLRKREPAEEMPDDRKTVAVPRAADGAASGSNPIVRTEVASPERLREANSRLSWPARDSAMAQQQSLRPGQPTPSGDEKTRLYVPKASDRVASPDTHSEELAPDAGASQDPVVGWLVIIEGPGKGRSLELGVGANAIGRDKGQKVKLDFGDSHISREKHALIVHDPKSMRFFLQSGDARNLTYLGEEVVLNPVQLTGREIIVVGETRLMFVPFCGPDFGWS